MIFIKYKLKWWELFCLLGLRKIVVHRSTIVTQRDDTKGKIIVQNILLSLKLHITLMEFQTYLLIFLKYEFVILTISSVSLTGIRDVCVAAKALFLLVKLFGTCDTIWNLQILENTRFAWVNVDGHHPICWVEEQKEKGRRDHCLYRCHFSHLCSYKWELLFMKFKSMEKILLWK